MVVGLAQDRARQDGPLLDKDQLLDYQNHVLDLHKTLHPLRCSNSSCRPHLVFLANATGREVGSLVTNDVLREELFASQHQEYEDIHLPRKEYTDDDSVNLFRNAVKCSRNLAAEKSVFLK